MPQLQARIHQIQALLKDQHIEALLEVIEQLNIADQAKVLADMPEKQQFEVFSQLQQRSLVLEFMPLPQQLALVIQLPTSELVHVLDAMHSDDFIDLFKALPSALQQQVLPQLSTVSTDVLAQLASYVEGTAGSIMSSNYVTLSPDLNMNEAITALRNLKDNHDTLYLIYIVDEHHHLLGVISLREIIQAHPDAIIQEVMTHDVVSAEVNNDQEIVARTLAHYDFIALPILDDAGRLLGIVTYDDAMDIVEAESTEDILRAGAIAPFEKQSIKTAPILSLYKNRVFWLVILVFGSLLSSFGIANYEDIIEQNIVLVFFLPLLVGSGGNAGSQSATLMVRALATGDVQLKDWFKLIARESLVALCLGLTMAFAVSILGYIRGDHMVALVLAISMTGIVILGCLIGMSLPFILNRLKLDPASASAPLVTSICDATGVVVYLFVASQLLL
ncbi:magnesium transporter [Acinetobacter wanghuae]|uniref:Magnesium transporter MgtE n=1 Tax=Acinetobacter wanghuae TaxID=2662362 RepID=A0A5Q0P657_9GAMM|nr:magnesium transporter [Acinetobacter wanghuae]MQW91709.1 magnesium transporter [Acinetobacter wanghuae]QGA11571.1 magnesium transporter [Acinetobacter wanghuae]